MGKLASDFITGGALNLGFDSIMHGLSKLWTQLEDPFMQVSRNTNPVEFKPTINSKGYTSWKLTQAPMMQLGEKTLQNMD